MDLQAIKHSTEPNGLGRARVRSSFSWLPASFSSHRSPLPAVEHAGNAFAGSIVDLNPFSTAS